MSENGALKAVLLFCAPMCWVQASVAQELSRCEPLRPIDTLVTLALDSGYSGYIEAPRPVPMGRQHWVFGRNGLAWRLPSTTSGGAFRRNAGFVLSEGRYVADIPLPTGREFLLAPAVRRMGDRALVVWGDGPDEIASQTNKLLFAHFTPAGWSPQDSLMLERSVSWSPLQHSDLEMRGDTLFLVTPYGTLDNETALFRRIGGVWSARSFHSGGRTYATLGISPSALYVLGIGGAIPPVNQRGVWLQTSLDGGETWSEPELVYALGQHHASTPTLIVNDDGSLFAVWSMSATPGPSIVTDVIVVAERSPAGAWHTRDSISVGRYWGLWLTRDLRGFHAIARRLDENDLFYVRWTGQSVCAGSLPDGAMGLPSPVIDLEQGDTVRVYWGRFAPGHRRLPLTMTRRFVPCC